MKANKFAELLSTTAAVQTTVDFQSAQLQTFSAQCKTQCTETKQALSSINDTLKALGLAQLPLTPAQTETLHNLQRSLAQQLKILNRDLAKPLAEYNKQFSKQEQKFGRVLQTINAETEPNGFDLNQIRHMIAGIKSIVDASKDQIAKCNIAINECQAKCFETQNKIDHIDMPQHMQETAKNIQQLTADLAQLNMHLHIQPTARQEYKADFLPLSKALLGLRLQSMSLLAEDAGVAHAETHGMPEEHLPKSRLS